MDRPTFFRLIGDVVSTLVDSVHEPPHKCVRADTLHELEDWLAAEDQVRARLALGLAGVSR